MIPRPPRSTRTYTPFPYTTPFRSQIAEQTADERTRRKSDTAYAEHRHRCREAPRARIDGGLDRRVGWSEIEGDQKNADCGENYDKRILRSEEQTSELQSLMRISYAVICVKKKTRR